MGMDIKRIIPCSKCNFNHAADLLLHRYAWHEGMLGSVNSFCAKLGSGIASALVGLIMGLAGYDGSLAVQSASANTSIIALFNYVPMILMIVLLLLAIAYKLDKELPQIKADLEAKRQAK